MAANEDGIDFESIVNDKLGVVKDDITTNTDGDPVADPNGNDTGVATTNPSSDPAGTDVTDSPATPVVAPAAPTTEAPAATTEEADATPTNLSIDDVRKVLEDRDAQVEFDRKRYQDITSEVATDLYPNGIDIALKDEQGHVIANVEDYKQYIDPNATTEDAQRIIMNEQSRLNKEVQQAREFISEKAELKNTMENEAVKVFKKYKDYFIKNPDIQQTIAVNYRKTLKLLNNTIVDAPTGLEDFYDFAMKPYVDAQASRRASPAVATPPAPTVPAPKETVSDERLDMLGGATDAEGTVVDGKPNWDKIVKNKLKG